jgi:hypothetical protein
LEERRFDDLTRALGQGASRRTVLKGLLGAAFGGALAAVGVRVPRAVLAATTCNGVPYDPTTQCCEVGGVQPVYPIADLDLCPNRVPHPGHVPEFNGCGPAQGFVSHIIPNRIGPSRNIDFTPACNNHDICYDTCNSVKSDCDRAFLADMTAACTVAYSGRGWFDRYMRTACTADAYLYYTAVSKTSTGTEAYESAQKEACDCCAICPECGGPSDERCCNGFCRPSCPVGYHRDPENCDCVKDDDGGGKGGDCPVCQSGTAGNCVPDSSQDGATCNACGHCSNGACVPDPNKSCPTCHQCGAGGVCEPQTDNTSCGTGQVCCNGTCLAGESCGPCPDGPNGHQCPPDVEDRQICCYGDDSPCCADDQGYAMCGATNGVCCTVGTQTLCGDICCDAATEQCGFYGDPPTATCCPNGQFVVSDGTCCDEARYCSTDSGSICCPSGQQCATDPEQTVFICCAGAHADSDGQCCTEPTYYAHCADDAYICCPSGNDATCCVNHEGI